MFLLDLLLFFIPLSASEGEKKNYLTNILTVFQSQ